MEATANQSKACCNVPPVVVNGYKEKGRYITLGNDTKCYTTGPSNATSAIFIIYDIFGYSPQALQGADILAHADSNHQYQVFMPDFFKGKYLTHNEFPPDNADKQKAVGDFFAGPANFDENPKKVAGLVKDIEGQFEGIKKWGAVGFCWGGKIVSLTSRSSTPWTCIAQAHPAKVEPSDAPKITVPTCMLASKDEDAEEVKKFGENLKVDKHIETFPDQLHGWMAARGDLGDEKVRKEFERGYGILLDWFHKYL